MSLPAGEPVANEFKGTSEIYESHFAMAARRLGRYDEARATYERMLEDAPDDPAALNDYGIRAILAPSFADIFYNNCFNNGMLPIKLPSATIDQLFHDVRAQDGYELTISLIDQQIVTPDGKVLSFDIDPFLKERLLKGWDQIGLTLRHEDKIATYERRAR